MNVHLPKIGRKSQPFTYQAFDMAAKQPELMPRYLDVEAAMRDMNLFAAWNSVLQTLSELEQMVKDTQSVAGSEAYTATCKAYVSLKKADEKMGLGEVIDFLSQYFGRSRSTPFEPAS